MTRMRYLMIAALLFLAACEQAQMFGPLGGATVSVTDLRTGESLVSGELTDDEATASAAIGDGWNDLVPVGKALFLGNHTFADSSVFVDATWYLMRIEGGDDYFADGNFLLAPNPVPVSGAVHAIVTGAQLKASGILITPVTDAVYQYAKDFLDDLDDDELAQYLDLLAAELVGDTDADDDVDYNDVLKWNRVLHLNSNSLLISQATLDELSAAISAGDTNQADSLADALFDTPPPVGNDPEAIYEDSISAIITRQVGFPGEGGCGSGCHYPGGSGSQSSNNDLVPPSNPNYVQLNTQNFRDLVNSNSVTQVTNKVRGIGHGGGTPIPSNSPEFATFEAWLNLL